MEDTEGRRNTILPPVPSPPSSRSGSCPPPPASHWRKRASFEVVVNDLRMLTPEELADVQRFALRTAAARFEEPTPELVSELVATAARLFETFRRGVPISLLRAGQPSTPRGLLDKALFAAEARELLRLEPVALPAPGVEIGAGIRHARGLLYWVFPQ